MAEILGVVVQKPLKCLFEESRGEIGVDTLVAAQRPPDECARAVADPVVDRLFIERLTSQALQCGVDRVGKIGGTVDQCPVQIENDESKFRLHGVIHFCRDFTIMHGMKQPNDNESIRLRPEIFEELRVFSELTGKPADRLVEEALVHHFERLSEELALENDFDDNAQTNLSYDEFWDGVDL